MQTSAIFTGMQTTVSFSSSTAAYAIWSMGVLKSSNGASRLLEGLAEHEQLHLVVDGEHTGTGNTTENVGTSTLEERLDALLGNDLLGGIEGRLVLDGLCNYIH